MGFQMRCIPHCLAAVCHLVPPTRLCPLLPAAAASADVAASVAAADSADNPYNGGRGPAGQDGGPPYWVPPSIAIAHHLIKAWVDHVGAWFDAAATADGTPAAPAVEGAGPARPSSL